MRTLTYTVPRSYDGRTVKFCLKHGLSLSDGAISRIRWQTDGVTVNGVFAPMTAVVRAGDILSVPVGDTKTGGAFSPVELPLEILYEDGDLLIVNKPAGLAVHGKNEKGDVTLGSALAFRYGTESVFHPVNRLDKDTSGAMVVAKSGYVHDRLRKLLHSSDFSREYSAVTVGVPSPETGRIDAPLGKIGDGWKRGVCPGGQAAVTEYAVERVWDGLALVRITPRTGRTHQIRAHMAYAGCPLLGDKLYGTADSRISRHALHSARIRLTHPLTGESIEVTAELPQDMKKLAP